ncbi:MAG TPA: sulfatase-like hydrolase/transferase, partial [Pirellulaceae bacterium]|nr:sulfatase-like hydrolase/transferase [Pirellulaceae bacterium]
MLHHHLLYLIATLILTCLSVGSSINAHIHASESKSQCVPNIVFILADDLGWSDLGCYGADYHESPCIDNLAREGILFRSAYAMPVCSPTR